MRSLVCAWAIVRDGGRILLVQNQWPLGTAWSLPGGRREEGEVLEDTVRREVREETGLSVEPGELAFVLDLVDPQAGEHFLHFMYPARVVGGALALPDQDEYVRDVRWVDEPELGRYYNWPTYRDPLLAWLRGEGRRYYARRDAGWGL